METQNYRRAAQNRPRDVVGRPLLLLAILILALNDHVLKAAWPGVLSGKLSDLCGLFAFPLVAWGALDLLARRGASLNSLRCLAGLTAALFVLLKTAAPVREGYQALYGLLGLEVRVAPDPTDLLCLIAPLLAYVYGAWHLERVLRLPWWPRLVGWLRWVVIGSFAVLTAATAPLQPAHTVGCQRVGEEGEVAIGLDRRHYVDRQFEAVLPAGPYQRITLLRRLPAPEPGSGVEPQEVRVRYLLQLEEDDANLPGDPAYLPLDLSAAEEFFTRIQKRALDDSPPEGAYRLEIVHADGRRGRVDFRIRQERLE